MSWMNMMIYLKKMSMKLTATQIRYVIMIMETARVLFKKIYRVRSMWFETLWWLPWACMCVESLEIKQQMLTCFFEKKSQGSGTYYELWQSDLEFNFRFVLWSSKKIWLVSSFSEYSFLLEQEFFSCNTFVFIYKKCSTQKKRSYELIRYEENRWSIVKTKKKRELTEQKKRKKRRYK